jgi:fructokinase
MTDNPFIIFGEVLFDHFPVGSSVLGGAPFNVAWHLQAFGQNPVFISRVGSDIPGKQIRITMNNWGLNTSFLQEDLTHSTGQVQVTLKQGEPTYAILPDQAYDHIDYDNLSNADYSGFLYHGTLATRSTNSKRTLEIIKSSRTGKIFIDVNLREPWWNKAEVLQLIYDADWVKLNMEEFKALWNIGDNIQLSMESFLIKHHLEGVIVTCAEKGAFGLTGNGNFCSVKPQYHVAIIDTVGAGDAFAAVIMLGLKNNWDFELCMARAQDFASAITGQTGAIADDFIFYTPFLNKWLINN